MGVYASNCNDAHLLCTAILTRRMLGIQSLIVFLKVVVLKVVVGAMAVVVVHPVLAMKGMSSGREVK